MHGGTYSQAHGFAWGQCTGPVWGSYSQAHRFSTLRHADQHAAKAFLVVLLLTRQLPLGGISTLACRKPCVSAFSQSCGMQGLLCVVLSK